MPICGNYTQMILAFQIVIHQKVLSLMVIKLRGKSNYSSTVEWFRVFLGEIDSNYSYF